MYEHVVNLEIEVMDTEEQGSQVSRKPKWLMSVDKIDQQSDLTGCRLLSKQDRVARLRRARALNSALKELWTRETGQPLFASDRKKSRRTDAANVMLEFALKRLLTEIGPEATTGYLEEWIKEFGVMDY